MMRTRGVPLNAARYEAEVHHRLRTSDGMAKGQGGSADRVLPILVRMVARNEEQGRTTINRMMEVDANEGVNIVRIRRLEDAHGRSMRDNEALQQDLAATRAKVIELRARQRLYERHLLDVER
ncbi:hypothetical protein Lser_V15G28139 [Lactuca serriola]